MVHLFSVLGVQQADVLTRGVVVRIALGQFASNLPVGNLGSIPHWLAEEFRTYCSKLYGLTPDDRVFYMTCTALNKELARCTKITYLPDIRVHDLRHSHVSLCIELGYSIVLVAKRIGDTVPVVMRTYAHLYPNKQQELVSRLETLSTSSSSKDESDLMPLV